MLRRTLLALSFAVSLVVAAPPAANAATYSAPLMTAISDLVVASETRTGYSRDLFPHWIDADGDGCSTRNEVLIAEADDPVTVGSGCSLSVTPTSEREWMPTYDKCRYLREWVAVKHRWRLTVDSGEKSALSSLAAGCTNTTITVTLAR